MHPSLLIKYHICTEEDLTGTNGRLQEIKRILQGKIPNDLIKDRYGDANKPFSELWTEEHFSFIRAEGFKGNRQYVLDIDDHEKLFDTTSKAQRVSISENEYAIIVDRQNSRCNICGSILKKRNEITNHTFEKDRVVCEIDHRIPIDRNGESSMDNYQALCHYCNKCKRQICYICSKNCSNECALVNPEHKTVILATGEDIIDRMKKSEMF